MTRAALAVVAALAVGYLAGRCADGPAPYAPPATPVVDSLPASHWRAEADRLADLLAERDGTLDRLRARIRGLESREPAVVERVDTVIDVRSVPVVVGVVADRSGRLDVLRASPADSVGLRRPEIARAVDLSRCDDGWALDGSRVVCDVPRLGHLTAFARLGYARGPDRSEPVGSIGVRWVPYYRATWGVEARATTAGRVEVSADVGVRLW
mgnify:FL=1